MIDFYPRNMILRLKEFMKESGIADDAILGVELEFYIFNNVKFFTKTNSSMYEIETNEGFWNEEVPKMPIHKGYHSTIPNDVYADVRNAMATTLEDIGIPVRYHHHEVGSAQQEIELSLIDIQKAADNTTISKYLIKNLANANDLTVTFMPKPIFGEAGSGMHVHQYLTKEGKNVFLGKKYKNLSQKGLYYIGGILKHSKALAALTNPSTNSYKRLIPGYEAPVSICFGASNRSAAIRIPAYVKNLQETRMEYRPIDAMSNAYYAFTAMVLAGLDGIINKIDPVKLGYGPVEKNVYEGENNFDNLPKDLEEALEHLDNDRKFLKLGNLFSDDLIDLWIERKKDEEKKIREVPNPLEFEYYYDF
jgi:glutamine synthetase